MHDGTVKESDDWLRANIGPVRDYAFRNDALLIVTFDEDDPAAPTGQRIFTVFVGGWVLPGIYSQRIDHQRVLRTLLDMHGLALIGNTSNVAPITGIWRPSLVTLPPVTTLRSATAAPTPPGVPPTGFCPRDADCFCAASGGV